MEAMNGQPERYDRLREIRMNRQAEAFANQVENVKALGHAFRTAGKRQRIPEGLCTSSPIAFRHRRLNGHGLHSSICTPEQRPYWHSTAVACPEDCGSKASYSGLPVRSATEGQQESVNVISVCLVQRQYGLSDAEAVVQVARPPDGAEPRLAQIVDR